MVTKVQITTTVASDGSVRLHEDQIQPAGIRAGDRIRVEIVKDEEPEGHSVRAGSAPPTVNGQCDSRSTEGLSFDEWLERGRAMLDLDDDVDIEELIRLGEEDAAREYWERLDRHG